MNLSMLEQKNCVVLCCDDNYLPFARVLVKDIHSQSPNLPIYILIPEGSTRSKLSPFQDIVNFVEIKLDMHENYLNRSSHISISTYLRLFIPEFLPSHIQDFLYLDIDLLLLGSVEEIFEIKSDFAFNMVPAEGRLTHHHLVQDIEKIFYGGVMLVNTARWKELNVTKNCLEIAKNHGPFANQDNDLLLIVSKDIGFGELPVKYNVMNYQNIAGEVLIVHFPGTGKPWNSYQGGSHSRLWRQKYRSIEPEFRLGLKTFCKDKVTVLKNVIYRKIVSPYLKK